MSNLIVLRDSAVLATCLERLPLRCADFSYCGFNLIKGVYGWLWPISSREEAGASLPVLGDSCPQTVGQVPHCPWDVGLKGQLWC